MKHQISEHVIFAECDNFDVSDFLIKNYTFGP